MVRRRRLPYIYDDDGNRVEKTNGSADVYERTVGVGRLAARLRSDACGGAGVDGPVLEAALESFGGSARIGMFCTLNVTRNFLNFYKLERPNPFLESLGLPCDHGWIVEGVGEYGYSLCCG